ncbi:MerC domain-containing protein [Aquimarina sp. I32.4]|uniref:MerC domain-containing protein n=1 Tax=Aquimarina sp. I32.4 TaxID=2053903 RepID=UPI000CDEDF34|nr:MerC domain-containing protein [Aquimarina sp. I32.4]
MIKKQNITDQFHIFMTYKTIRINWDIIGVSASFLCILHCILLPVLITLFPVIGLPFLSNELHELILVGASLLIAFVAIYNGYKKYHHKSLPFYIYLLVLALFTIGFVIENHLVEKIMHFSATGLLITSHYYNWRFIKRYKNCTIKSLL